MPHKPSSRDPTGNNTSKERESRHSVNETTKVNVCVCVCVRAHETTKVNVCVCECVCVNETTKVNVCATWRTC